MKMDEFCIRFEQNLSVQVSGKIYPVCNSNIYQVYVVKVALSTHDADVLEIAKAAAALLDKC